LRQRRGENGAPIYFAYRGVVYDASASWHWRGGRHWAAHPAGEDLTGTLAAAPHGEDLLARLPVAGALTEGDEPGQASPATEGPRGRRARSKGR